MLRLPARGQILYTNYPTRNGLGNRHAGSGVRSARRVFDACNVECNTSRVITETMQARNGAAARQSRMATTRRRATSATGIDASQNGCGTDSCGTLRELWGLSIGWEGVNHWVDPSDRFLFMTGISASGMSIPFLRASSDIWIAMRAGKWPHLRQLNGADFTTSKRDAAASLPPYTASKMASTVFMATIMFILLELCQAA